MFRITIFIGERIDVNVIFYRVISETKNYILKQKYNNTRDYGEYVTMKSISILKKVARRVPNIFYGTVRW